MFEAFCIINWTQQRRSNVFFCNLCIKPSGERWLWFFKCQLLIVRWRWILQTVAGNGMWALSKASFHTVSQNYLSLWSESRIPHHTVTAFLPSSQLVQPTSVQSFSWQLLSPVKIQQTEQNLSLVLLKFFPNNIWPCWGPALQSLS